MEFALSEEQQMLVDTIRNMGKREKFKELARHIDETGELPKLSPMIAAPVFESNVGPVRVIDIFGTEEQKKAIVPGVCRGEMSVSVCMTEPEAGSDLTALTTHAVEEGDGYILNGRKCFITGG